MLEAQRLSKRRHRSTEKRTTAPATIHHISAISATHACSFSMAGCPGIRDTLNRYQYSGRIP